MNIIISGALGRMGRILAEAAKSAGVKVVCGVDASVEGQTADFLLARSYDQLPKNADAVIDFSVAENLDALLEYVLRTKTALVLCVTGYTERQMNSIHMASKQIPILHSANMSFGIQVLAQLAAMAARALGEGFDIEIVEKHHNKKADNPSGTALMLGDAIRKERGNLRNVYGRSGKVGERKDDEIGIHAVRGGTVSGEHEVGFYGDAEEIILTHRAENRALFARGALRSASFLCKQPPGLYTIRDAVSDRMK